MMTALYNLQLITNGTISAGKAVLIDDGFIVDVVDTEDIPPQAQKTDLNGAYLAPGFIDLQIYGAGQPLFFGGKPSVEALAQMETCLLSQGCTGFLATIATNTSAIVEQGIQSAIAYRKQGKGTFMGLHLEGPYLNTKRKGAHPANLIKKATLAEVKQWVDMAEGEIKIITLAPELQDEAVLNYIDNQGIIISSGHSDATYSQAKAFIHHPIKAITHLYNAMPQMHHRQPGIIPAVFEMQPYTSIVADGIHVDYSMIKLAKRQLGDKLFLITDAVSASNEGVYQHQFNADHYVMPDGTLSGSALTMLGAVANCVKYANIDLAEAVNMASLYPARLVKQDDGTGKIEKNYRANMIVFDDNFEVSTTIYNGNITKSTQKGH